MLFVKSVQEFVAQFRLQQEWFDERLKFTEQSEYRSFEFIHMARDQRIWIPVGDYFDSISFCLFLGHILSK
jgi:hypothetical protein